MIYWALNMSLRVLLLRLFQTVFSTFKMFSFYGSPKSPFPPPKNVNFDQSMHSIHISITRYLLLFLCV